MDALPHDRAERIARLAELIAELAAALAEEQRASPPPAAAEPTAMLDVGEAARLLGISRASLYDGPIRRGELLTVLIGSRRLVPRSTLDAYIAALIEHAS